MNVVVLAPRGSFGVERPVLRVMTSVASGPEEEEAPRTVSTQTRREFAIRSSSISSEEPVVAVDEESMEAGESSTKAVVGSSVVSGTVLSVRRPGQSGN